MIEGLAGGLAQHGMRLVNRLAYRHAGGEARPTFFDIDRTLPELRRIERRFVDIRRELDAVLPRVGEMPRYHELDAKQEAISNADPRFWKVFFVYLYHEEEALEGRRLCPRTAEVVGSIPGVLNAFFSIMEPGKSVPAHEGPSYHYLRYHLGLRIPENRPPSIRVKDETYTWKTGEGVLFDDSWNHEVINDSDDVRVVLIVDVLRPMSWMLNGLNRAVRSIASLGMTEAGREVLAQRAGLQAGAGSGR